MCIYSPTLSSADKRYCDTRQTAATIERSQPNTRHATGYRNTVQATATAKRIIVDTRNATSIL